MATVADFLTLLGYEAPRASDFLTTIRDAVVALLDEAGEPTDIDFDRDIVFGILTAVNATQLGDLGQASQALYDMLDPNNATGIQLDSHGSIVGVPRFEATESRVTLRLGTSSGSPVSVLAGSIAEGGGDDGKARWVLLSDATIPAASTVDVLFEAQEAGATTALIGDINTIVTVVPGWETVTNPAIATPGRDLETDAEYRLRRQESLQVTGGRSINSLRSTLLALEDDDGDAFVLGAGVVDNDTAVATVFEGIALAPHSTAVIIHPPTITTDEKQIIAEAIYQQVSAGIFTNGTAVVASVVGGDGFVKTIRYDFAAELALTVAALLTLDTGFAIGDVDQAVEDAIQAYLDTLSVGDDVLFIKVLSAIASIEGVLGAALTLNGGGVDVSILLSQIVDQSPAYAIT